MYDNVWTKIGKNAQNRERQEWAKERPMQDNDRKMRWIYLIDPHDKEYSEVVKNARRKLERSIAPAMPCKRDRPLSSIPKTRRAEEWLGKGVQNNVWLYSGIPRDNEAEGRNIAIQKNTNIVLLGKDSLP